MGIISSELECCWSEMGFHLLKSCRLYSLSLQEFWHRHGTHGIFVFEPFPQWRCRFSLWCVVFVLASFSQALQRVRGRRSVAVAHRTDKMFIPLWSWVNNYPIFFEHQVAVTLSYFLKEWWFVLSTAWQTAHVKERLVFSVFSNWIFDVQTQAIVVMMWRMFFMSSCIFKILTVNYVLNYINY